MAHDIWIQDYILGVRDSVFMTKRAVYHEMKNIDEGFASTCDECDDVEIATFAKRNVVGNADFTLSLALASCWFFRKTSELANEIRYRENESDKQHFQQFS